MINFRRMFPTPIPSLRTQRNLRDRYAIMQRWHGISLRAGKNTCEYESWERSVDHLFDAVEDVIYTMGHNPWDHTRRKESA